MLQIHWQGHDPLTSEIDPGKDIFALLFLAFFLINAVILFCVSNQVEQRTRVNTARAGGPEVIEAGQIARIETENEKIWVIQQQTRYLIPDDIENFKQYGLFETNIDHNGEKQLSLLALDPGQAMSAGEMLKLVQILNLEKISVDFRANPN